MPLELFFDLVTRSLIAFHTVAVSQFQQTATTAVPRAARSANATNLATMSLGCRWLHTACGWLCARACVAAVASSRYGKRLLTDPDDRLGDPLFGEPAADFGKKLSSRPGRRRPLVVEVPAIVALPADAAAVAPQPLGEQDRAQLIRCADPHPTSV